MLKPLKKIKEKTRGFLKNTKEKTVTKIKDFKEKGEFIKSIENLKKYNKWTETAFTVKTDEDFKKLCLKCIEDTAKKNNKDKFSVSFDDIFRGMEKLKNAKLFKIPYAKKITLKFIKNASDITNWSFLSIALFTSIINLNPVGFFASLGFKNFIKLETKLKYTLAIYCLSVFIEEVYKTENCYSEE